MQAHTYTEYLKMFGKNRSKRHFAAENLKSIHNEGPSKIHENKKKKLHGSYFLRKGNPSFNIFLQTFSSVMWHLL